MDTWTLAFSPDSQYLATGTHVGKVNLFGVESGEKEYSLDTRGKFILSIAYSPDGKYLASGAVDGIINIFDIATGKLLHTLEGAVHHSVQTGLSDHKGRLTLSLKCY